MARRYQSRLSKRALSKSKKNFIYSVLGIFALIFVLLKFGLPALINLSIFLAGNKTDTSTKQSNSAAFISPPTLNQTYEATNSATVTISGNALEKEKIKIFVNGDEIDTEDTKDDGSFHFDNVKLQPGQNVIKAKAENSDKKESDYSNEISITFANKQPTLSIDSPSDGQNFSKDQSSVVVSGKTDSGNRVTVNGFWAITDDNGNYSYTIQLSGGDNMIKVVSTDSAGNSVEKDRKVTRSQ